MCVIESISEFRKICLDQALSRIKPSPYSFPRLTKRIFYKLSFDSIHFKPCVPSSTHLSPVLSATGHVSIMIKPLFCTLMPLTPNESAQGWWGISRDHSSTWRAGNLFILKQVFVSPIHIFQKTPLSVFSIQLFFCYISKISIAMLIGGN